MAWKEILEDLKPIEFPEREDDRPPDRSIDESLREITRVAEKIGRIHFRASQNSELTVDRIQEIGRFLEEHVESVEESLRDERMRVGELESTLGSAIATLMELTDLGASAATAARRELGREAASQFDKLYAEMLRACARIGLEATTVEGEKFEPAYMEAIEEVSDSGREEGSVTEVVRQGYRFEGEVRRIAKVVIAR